MGLMGKFKAQIKFYMLKRYLWYTVNQDHYMCIIYNFDKKNVYISGYSDHYTGQLHEVIV